MAVGCILAGIWDPKRKSRFREIFCDVSLGGLATMAFDTNQDAYVSLRSIMKERTSGIVAWVGSGLSAPLGIPLWPGLRKALGAALGRKLASYEPADRASAQVRAQAVASQTNPWVAFQMLQRELGKATYRDVIREAVRPADTAPAPESYRYLWKLRIRGLINLNIDRLATKAFVETRQSNPLEFTGTQGTRLGYLLKEPRPFIINLHGHADDYSSWVFTKSELDNLRASPGYAGFIQTCFLANTVLFLGLSADDVAVGGHLEALAAANVESGTHFWATARTDRATDEWAESIGVRVIRYDALGDDHSALNEMFEDLLSFIPPEDAPEDLPVVSNTSRSTKRGSLPSPSDLAKQDTEDIRRTLNDYVKGLLDLGADADREYRTFRKEYDEAIYRAWYVNPRNGVDSLLGYKVEQSVAKGAFGTVYRATGAEGEPLAIKILLEEIRNNDELLQSFRRGVRSMRILTQHQLDGVVGYRDSSEIPAFVVMDWVDGPSLQEAVESRALEDWQTILRTAKHLTRILREAHELPERVLHRDLRPSNVMLKGFYTEPEDWKVVVLDFDLSWHRGATERSVVHGSTLFGYLAPEQMIRIPGVSTRNSAVDSFGLGMVLFFMVDSRHPIPAEHRHTDWSATVQSACGKHSWENWKSLPARFARLIMNATRDQQATRWDVMQIETELNRLWEVATRPESIVAPDLLAEEVASRVDVFRTYLWDEDLTGANTELPTGLRVRLRGDSVGRRLVLDIEWQNTGVHRRRKVGKWVGPASKNCAAMLRAEGWDVTEDVDLQALLVRASRDADSVRVAIHQCAAGIDRAIGHLRTM